MDKLLESIGQMGNAKYLQGSDGRYLDDDDEWATDFEDDEDPILSVQDMWLRSGIE